MSTRTVPAGSPTSTTRPRRRMRTVALAVGAAVAGTLLVAAPSSASAAPGVSGIDVASYQHAGGAIGWAKVFRAGQRFAIIKATEDTGYTNPWFATDRAGANRAGLAAGAYHFARPQLPISSAADQAAAFVNAIGSVNGPATLPPVLDLEVSGGLGQADLITWTQTFLETVRARTGRTPVVYSYVSFWSDSMGSTTALTRYPLWLAAYRSSSPAPVGGWPAWTMWQHTSVGSVPGIVGDVDMNLFAGDAAALARFADGRVATPFPVRAPSAPLGLSASGGVRSASVSWVPSDDGGAVPASYTVVASPGGARATVSGTASRAVIGGLAPGATYSFTVRATNRAGTSPASAPSPSILSRDLPPSAPTAVSARASAGKVVVRWAASTRRPDGYQVTRCRTNSPAQVCATSATPSARLGAAARSWTDTAVTGGPTYTYRVSSWSRWGSSARSTPARVTTPVTSLPAPTGLTAVPAAGLLTLAWQPVRWATTYELVRCAGLACTPNTLSGTVRGTSAGQIVPAGSTWTYGVRAVNGRVRSRLSSTLPLTALVPTTLQLVLPSQLPPLGGSATVGLVVRRGDTGAVVPLAPVTVVITPTAGGAAQTVQLVTGPGGTASLPVPLPSNRTVTMTVTPTGLASATISTLLRVRPAMTATLSAASTVTGTPVTLTGATDPAMVGETVVEQRSVRGTWYTVATSTVGADGSYQFVVAATSPAVLTLRVDVAAQVSHDEGFSPTVTLTVR